MVTASSLRVLLGIVALVVPLTAQKVPDIRIDHKPGFPEFDVLDPQIAAVGDAVYVTWFDERHGPSPLPNTAIYFNRSLDAGRSWLPEDVRLDTGIPAGQFRNMFPRIAASADAVYVVWQDARNGMGDIYVNVSLDKGTTWLVDPVRIDTGTGPGAANSFGPDIAASGGSVYVVWEDTRDGESDIYFNRSLDDGGTWLVSDVRIDTGDVAGADDSQDPRVVSDGGSVYVVWEDVRNGPANPFLVRSDIYFNRSLDSGTTWLPTAVQVDTDGPSVSDSLDPDIAADGASVYITWRELRPGPLPDVYFNRSLDSGSTFLPNDIRLDVGVSPASAYAGEPQIAAVGSSVYVTWNDNRNGADDIFVNRSVDSGGTWLAAPVRVDVGSPPGVASASGPVIAASGSAVFVSWRDDRNVSGFSGASDIYFNRSLDNGLTWLATDLRIDTGVSPGGGGAWDSRITAVDNSVYVVWKDARFHTKDHSDLFFNIPLGVQPYGTGLAGSGGFTPLSMGSGLPTLGSTISIDLSDGLGGASGGLLPSFQGQASIPVFGGILLVQPPLTPIPITLGGGAGIPGGGTFSLPVSIPISPSLVGLRVNVQAMFLDSGASGGVSMTGGLEVWIG